MLNALGHHLTAYSAGMHLKGACECFPGRENLRQSGSHHAGTIIDPGHRILYGRHSRMHRAIGVHFQALTPCRDGTWGRSFLLGSTRPPSYQRRPTWQQTTQSAILHRIVLLVAKTLPCCNTTGKMWGSFGTFLWISLSVVNSGKILAMAQREKTMTWKPQIVSRLRAWTNIMPRLL